MNNRYTPVVVAALVLAPALLRAQVTGPSAAWQELRILDEQLAALERPDVRDFVPDLSRQAIDARAAALSELRGGLLRLHARISTERPAERVDYLIVWSRLNALDFEHRVTRPWSRDPIYHLDFFRRLPFSEVPVEESEVASFRRHLEAVPRIVAQAEASLDEAVGELAGQAIFHLESFDGVGQGEPYRDDPPEGTVGWFADLCVRLERAGSPDEAACRRAAEAVAGYRDWLTEHLPMLESSAGIGTDELARYLREVRLLPYSVDEARLLGEREFHRYRAAWEIVRNRNGSLPELELTTSREQHEARTREAERQIRALVRRQRILTFPDEIPEAFDTDTYWSPRALVDRHFWEELQFRNTFNNHIHASIPGHRFDGLLARSGANPIRKRSSDSTRAEGWATYLEEMFLLAGLTREVPRADELFYIALMKRASRIYAEVMMHAGRFSLDEANAFMIDNVPFMEEDLGRYDLEGYLRRPGSGSGYILGKIQLEQLLSEQSLALGSAFELGEFHDRVLSYGIVPLALIRYEMTGRSEHFDQLWERAGSH